MSREIIHNKFTLADRPFICEGQLGLPTGTLVVESDFEDEFKVFLTLDNPNNTIGFIFKNETISETCGMYQKLYFAFHKANDSMNLRRFRCSIRPALGLIGSDVKLSDEGVIKVIPSTYVINSIFLPTILKDIGPVMHVSHLT
ncbi:hypothetical protein DPMN_138646 [Dreissena polymorpha]|uniref:Uncharacterized protein n=1 Tax=Dreissena polymorpha TaxID=45954 RepID=A0A9D4G4N3_DREPO|nr:hypothetical protein DPMN_138646 [Dreissena polymorpha]